jgi:hypothetical protein
MPHFEIVRADQRFWLFRRGTIVDIAFSHRGQIRRIPLHTVRQRHPQPLPTDGTPLAMAAKL